MRYRSLALAAAVCFAQQPVRLVDGAFRIDGGGVCSDLSVFVGEARADQPALLGSCQNEAGTLVFRPRFPLQGGLRYRVSWRGADTVFEIPKPAAGPATRLEHLYPSTDRWPENQLKFYLHFSAPMSRGEAFRRLRLIDENGAARQLPFLELDEELWDREGKRLTVFFDPGRIKRGLVPNEEVGPPIERGKRYTLIVDRGWLDARGESLAEEFRKTFEVMHADRKPPDPKTWKVRPPGSGAREPLEVDFPEPLDHALLLRLITVVDAGGRTVDGDPETAKGETEWRFTPLAPWRAGRYSLRIGTALEDLAGNRIGRPFDVDVFERVERRLTEKTVTLPFRVR